MLELLKHSAEAGWSIDHALRRKLPSFLTLKALLAEAEHGRHPDTTNGLKTDGPRTTKGTKGRPGNFDGMARRKNLTYRAISTETVNLKGWTTPG